MGKKHLGLDSLTKIGAIATFSWYLSNGPVVAQIVADDTLLPDRSQVTPNGNIFIIEGGTAENNNLFHSFEQFSLPTNNTAFFNNDLRIENIFTRVTGGQISEIDGLIQANGTANLFLLNPNGIFFGPNARLDVGGSFFATTAESIIFENNQVFSANNPENPPLLTINVPIGLQFGSNPGKIAAEGVGHNLIQNPRTSQLITGDEALGFEVLDNTLALVGAHITLSGATLTAKEGRIELGAVGSQLPAPGLVNLSPTNSGWVLEYEERENLGDIQLLSSTALYAAGMLDASIHIKGENLTVKDNSIVLLDNQGDQEIGAIEIEIGDRLNIEGIVNNGIFSQTLGEGKSEAIAIKTDSLELQDGSLITSLTFGNGPSGDITVMANSIELTAFKPDISMNSGILANTLSDAGAGNVTVSATTIKVFEGSFISSLSQGQGDGGNVNVIASELIEIVGVGSNGGPSNISASTFANGSAGNLQINTKKLILRDGGTISSSSFGDGNSGSLTIDAEEFVEVIGISPEFPDIQSTIRSSITISSGFFRLFFGLPEVPSGESGNTTIHTKNLRVSDGAFINVSNEGTGDGGSIFIDAEDITLSREGGISASTASGEGGNIQLQVDNLLLLDNNSEIEAEAGGIGNGGNISINSDIVAILTNSSINARAFAGTGGNIPISTQGLFISEDSFITASSEFGVSGTVTINNPELDPASGLIKLPEEAIDVSNKVFVGCKEIARNSFVYTRRGGLPEDPTRAIRSQIIWRDLQDFSISKEGSSSVSSGRETLPLELRQAKGWQITADDTVILTEESVLEMAEKTALTSTSCSRFFS